MKKISELEEIIKIDFGIDFKNDITLLQSALTHSTYANEHENCEHNERLEFLGDAVLGLVITEYCYEKFQVREGELTEKRKSIVKNEILFQVAEEMVLEEFLLIGKGENENKEEKAKQKRIGNALEALIGAIFLHTDYETAKEFIKSKFLKCIEDLSKEYYDSLN